MFSIKTMLHSPVGPARLLGPRNMVKSRAGKARLFGIAGGLVGMAGVLVAIFVREWDFVLVIKEENNIEVSRTLMALTWALAGTLGGLISWRDSKIPGLIMVVSGVAGIVILPAYFAAGGALLIMGAVLAFASKNESTVE